VSSAAPAASGIGSFRAKLLIVMMLVISAMTALGLYLAHRNVAVAAERDLQQDFENELASLHRAEELRHGALTERCRTLVSKPRIHAALEDNALDLLYPSAKDELRDIMQRGEEPAVELHATFYRFLDGNGAVIPPPTPDGVGELRGEELSLGKLPQTQQIGYLWRKDDRGADTLDEVIAMPIVSTESGDVISALVVGFTPLELRPVGTRSGMQSGIWLNGRLRLAAISAAGQSALSSEIARMITERKKSESRFAVDVDRTPHLLFYKRLNAESLFPPAYEVCVYPLIDAMKRQRQLQLRILGAGGLLLVGGFVVSHFASMRLSRPIEQLAVQSEENRTERQRAEAVLASTSDELQRSARFSADASHQLKSPVTVLRAGLESLLARQDFNDEVYDELSSLLHQTYRLTGVIDDLLLLSRMDAGHVRIHFVPVNLTRVIEEWLDDLSALADAAEVEVETEFPSDLHISGERRYTTLIVQNLLENARKYNRAGGRIRVSAREEGDSVVFTVGNTGRPIPQATQDHIFERFHRGSVGENVPGHGLGLNLARELARLHGGELRLVRSDDDWTEFHVRFRAAARTQPAAVSVA
jgi:signal transduction histidine kinase